MCGYLSLEMPETVEMESPQSDHPEVGKHKRYDQILLLLPSPCVLFSAQGSPLDLIPFPWFQASQAYPQFLNLNTLKTHFC